MLTTHQQQLHSQVLQAIKNNQLSDAHQLLVKQLQQDATDHFCYYLLAEVNIAAGDSCKAIKLLEKALTITAHPWYSVHLAKLMLLAGNITAATRYYQEAVKFQGYGPLECDIIANIATRLGDYENALKWQKNAYKQAPEQQKISYNLAVAYKINGQLTQARSQLNTLLARHPNYLPAHYSQAELNSLTEAHAHIAKLKQLVNHSLAATEQQMLCHSLALNYEHIGDYKSAFTYFSKSKLAIKPHVNYQASKHHAFCQQLIALSKRCKLTPSNNEFSPIFVVGMPRSGTTLMEKIIHQSNEVTGLGELNDIAQLLQSSDNAKHVLNINTLKQAAEQFFNTNPLDAYQTRCTDIMTTERGCDKQPFNFYYIDFILAAFPAAKIICMLRNPLDSCIANYRQLYNPHSAFHHYSYDLLDIANFYQDYQALAEHFQRQYPNNVLIQEYEELVTTPILQTQSVFKFCDLHWQASCLDFYKHNSASATASKIQIRQPLNNKSIDYWQHYQHACNELLAKFGSRFNG
ncbi:tetratricopeptide repeat-containing sulfotransferase family protein [Pseudoalteromonas mariniglutinosa]|uniref:tetratricopeptide repeat-containing sulfotransferase family protein n=1 Tax=Pseudoalteromonas mariniglutinosa TaxID=206042 RepID=UPI00384EA609